MTDRNTTNYILPQHPKGYDPMSTPYVIEALVRFHHELRQGLSQRPLSKDDLKWAEEFDMTPEEYAASELGSVEEFIAEAVRGIMGDALIELENRWDAVPESALIPLGGKAYVEEVHAYNWARKTMTVSDRWPKVPALPEGLHKPADADRNHTTVA